MTQYSILSTKKLTPSLSKILAKQGIRCRETEMIRIEPVLNSETLETILPLTFEPGSAVVFTSRNAVEIVAATLRVAGEHGSAAHWNIFSLAGATRDAVMHLFDITPTGSVYNGGELATEIISAGNVERIIFFCSNQRRDELPTMLGNNAITVHEITTYETIETPVIIEEEPDGILFFSPSAVSSFFSVNQLPATTICFAIGNTTARALTACTTNKIIISEQPDQQSMLNQVSQYFINK